MLAGCEVTAGPVEDEDDAPGGWLVYAGGKEDDSPGWLVYSGGKLESLAGREAVLERMILVSMLVRGGRPVVWLPAAVLEGTFVEAELEYSGAAELVYAGAAELTEELPYAGTLEDEAALVACCE